jgi:Mrp family chromosome partitioning ATPase/capsular polysaccharide biosynthesis protein
VVSLSDERRGAVRYLLALRQHWLLIAISVVAALGTAVFYLGRSEKRYQATVDILIVPVSATDDTFQGLPLFKQSLVGSSPVVTAARLLDAPDVTGAARRAMGARLALAASIQLTPLSQADVVAVVATAPTPDDAVRAANTFARTAVRVRSQALQSALHEQIGRIEQQIALIPPSQRSGNFVYAALAQREGILKSYLGTPDPTVAIVGPAAPPAAPVWPRPKLTLVAALLASLLLGCGLAVLLEFWNPRLSTEEELQLTHRLPILARVPRVRARTARGYLLGKAQLPPPVWKGYRTLRAVLRTSGPDHSFPRSILVTGANQGDGKTMTAVNLAITLASAHNLRVILVDTDLHRPMIAAMFHVIGQGDGVNGVLAGGVPVDSALVQIPAHPRLRLLPARPEHTGQALFDSRRVQSLVDQLVERADVVVFDSAPLVEVAETLELAAAVDAVLVSVRLRHTKRESLDLLREMLARRGVSPAGFVVTTRTPAREGAADYTGYVVPDLPSLQGADRPTAGAPAAGHFGGES